MMRSDNSLAGGLCSFDARPPGWRFVDDAQIGAGRWARGGAEGEGEGLMLEMDAKRKRRSAGHEPVAGSKESGTGACCKGTLQHERLATARNE